MPSRSKSVFVADEGPARAAPHRGVLTEIDPAEVLAVDIRQYTGEGPEDPGCSA